MATKDRPTRNSATDDRELVAVARQVIDANRYLMLARQTSTVPRLAGNRR